jgi:hypothetical protein
VPGSPVPVPVPEPEPVSVVATPVAVFVPIEVSVPPSALLVPELPPQAETVAPTDNRKSPVAVFISTFSLPYPGGIQGKLRKAVTPCRSPDARPSAFGSPNLPTLGRKGSGGQEVLAGSARKAPCPCRSNTGRGQANRAGLAVPEVPALSPENPTPSEQVARTGSACKSADRDRQGVQRRSYRALRRHQSQVPEQGTKVPALAAMIAEEPVRPVAEAVTVIVPAPVAWTSAKARPW